MQPLPMTPDMLPILMAGFGLGFSLILAIGAQNAFVLRQGIRGQHVLPIVLTCALSDALLITAGVAGFGTLTSALPWFEPVMRIGGALFLTGYGLRSLRSAWTGGAALSTEGQGVQTALWPAVLTCLAFTWLNPHVYLDTVVLLGAISAQYTPAWVFGLGAVTASFVFFFTLGYGARLLAPIFARPRAWQVLDALIGVVMLALAVKLALM
ncbi:amino acid transporter [Rhodobacteraceae bacterium R_SAG7]|uniref:LysE/ArgO family amino acid transporter n=1 Tax=Ruegeria sp. (strain TM1040) TaxID=292414 RepID=UPI000046313E|nr:LysE/ArgO family amino acid transporter [Ruegeria sp. TM1040]ABF64623.1 Lysine exporter protein (LYSE/YGGA) [Ruegeria sp. TM1040]NKW78618.1 amino acid transporter [Rhodobacteraceae bacterium R_SAG7]